MFLKNCWYMGGWDHEVMDGKLLERRLLNQPVVFYRGESGQIVALDNRCCHRGAKLSQGRIEGDCVRCMYHGLKFDPTGKCVQIPGQDRIPPQLGVKSYPLVEKQHIMWIWMGDPALADPEKILDIPYLEDPKWKGIPAYLHYDSNYLLIMDNLSDFNHLAFVHTNTLGGSEEYAYVTKPVSIDRLPNGFHVERWHNNSDPPPYLRKVITNKTDKVDRRNTRTPWRRTRFWLSFVALFGGAAAMYFAQQNTPPAFFNTGPLSRPHSAACPGWWRQYVRRVARRCRYRSRGNRPSA